MSAIYSVYSATTDGLTTVLPDQCQTAENIILVKNVAACFMSGYPLVTVVEEAISEPTLKILAGGFYSTSQFPPKMTIVCIQLMYMRVQHTGTTQPVM